MLIYSIEWIKYDSIQYHKLRKPVINLTENLNPPITVAFHPLTVATLNLKGLRKILDRTIIIENYLMIYSITCQTLV